MAGLSALAAPVTMSPGCSQTKPECTVGSASGAPFTARLVLVEGDRDRACGQKKSLTVGMQVYHPDAGGVPDRSKKTVAIQTLDLSAAPRGGASLGKPYALGAFASIEPDDNELCHVPTFEPAQGAVLPEGTGGSGGSGDGGSGDGDSGGSGDGGSGDGGSGGSGDGGSGDGGSGGSGDGGSGGSGDGGTGEADPPESRSVKYEWSNMRVYVTAANLGNQFEADLTYTEEDCTAKYKVIGVWPQIDCQIYDPNPDPEGSPIPTGKKDDAICQDPASGLSPDLRVKCDPDPEQQTFTCALDAETIPAFR